MLLNCELGNDGEGILIWYLDLVNFNVTIDYPGTTNLFILVGKCDKII
jgi:hypothetical protein